MKKKVRFPILLKILLLSGILTLFVTATSLSVSIAISYNRQKGIYYNSCSSATTIVGDNFEELIENYTNYYDYLFAKYEETGYKYYELTSEQQDAYLEDINDYLYGREGTLGFDLEKGARVNIYETLSNYITEYEYSSISQVNISVFDFQKQQSLSWFVQGLGCKEKPSGKPVEVDQKQIDFFSSDKTEIQVGDGIQEYTIMLRLREYTSSAGNKYVYYIWNTISLEKFNQSTTRGFITELSICLGASILLMIIYGVLARFFLVRNIKKVGNSAQVFVGKIKNNEPLEVVETKVTSHDEVAEVYNDMIIMQKQMIEYVDNIKDAASKEEKLNAELQVASKIQLDSLPINTYFYKNIELRTFIRPSKIVGGDFYDYFLIDENNLAFIIADVSGKGVPASLFMMKAKESIKSTVLSGLSLTDVFKFVNNQLCYNNKENYFVTAFLGVLNLKSLELKTINAGHEAPYLISRGKIERLNVKSNFVLGMVENFEYEEEKMKLHKGDSIYLHTDGVNEAINEKEEEFGYEKIKDALATKVSPKDRLEAVRGSVDSFSYGEQFDDLTMLIVDIKENSLHLHYDDPKYEDIEDATDKMSEMLKSKDIEVVSKIGIILDEMMNNIISYAKVKSEKFIDITISYDKEAINLVIKDNGLPFNPLSVEEKTVQENLENNVEGGLGITIVRNIAKEVEYNFVDKCNYLIVKI